MGFRGIGKRVIRAWNHNADERIRAKKKRTREHERIMARRRYEADRDARNKRFWNDKKERDRKWRNSYSGYVRAVNEDRFNRAVSRNRFYGGRRW